MDHRVVALVLFCCLGPLASASEVPGLDSLAAATLMRALEYIELTPAELGFDKLAAEDDTFRLAIVERLLNEPLELPGWQTAEHAFYAEHRTRPALVCAHLGVLCEAGGGARWEREALAFGSPPSRPSPTLDERMAAFVRRAGQVAALLEEAFADLTPRERDDLLMMAPAFWGEGEESAELVHKGALHRELGVPVDTTIEMSADPILDMAIKLDRAALTHAAAEFLDALVEQIHWFSGEQRASATGTFPGVTGTIVHQTTTPWGAMVVGGPGPNTYSAAALERIAFLIDVDGDDVYRGRAASAVGELLRPLGAVIDLGGDDLYDARDYDYVLGGAVLGVAALIDLGGDDIYRGRDGVEGAGHFGIGLLYDRSGVDFFEGRNLCQGAGAFGLGMLVSDASAQAPPQKESEEDRDFTAGLVKVPGTGAVPIRFDEGDTYLCARQSQGFASTFGAGLLYDQAGSDVYRAGGRYLHAPLLPHDFQSLSQGFSIGFRPRAGGGVGILLDEEGNDYYDAEVYAQGASYWYSLGLLRDGAGNDRYLASQYGQGAGIHLAAGSLWDVGGDDHYCSKHGVVQGTAHDYSVGWLLDESGNDYYIVGDGQGISIANSTAIFIDAQGNDFYGTPRGGQGRVHWSRGFCGTGIFLDLEGEDVYPANAPGDNGEVWGQQTFGIGIDLDRTVDLPEEVLPEIELTAEDSLRTVEELFETASLWEVGNARLKVRTARMALKTKGMAAVDYIIAEQLGTQSGLEYRAISDLAKAYPDSFAARLLPLLEDEDERVQRMVIALLGDLKRSEAREPMEALLRKKKHQRLWTRLISTLGDLGEIEAAPSIRPFIEDERESRRIRVINALGALRDTTSVPAMIACLHDPIFTVRAAAVGTLRRFGSAAIAPLCESLTKPAKTKKQRARLADQRGLRFRVLGQLAGTLRDSTDLISLIARSRARKVLLTELERALEETTPAIRAAIVEGLLGLEDPETEGRVALHMNDEYDPFVLNAYRRAQQEE